MSIITPIIMSHSLSVAHTTGLGTLGIVSGGGGHTSISFAQEWTFN